MSEQANSMSAEWCAARLLPIRHYLHNVQAKDPERFEWRAWLIEMLSQIDNPPTPTALAAATTRAETAESAAAQLRGELAEQRGKVTAILEDFANGCVPVSGETTPYWLTVNSERARNLHWAELKCKELGIAWPIKAIPYTSNLPSEPALAAPLSADKPAAEPGERWFPKEVFDSFEEYEATTKDVIRRIESGEVQPREPDEEAPEFCQCSFAMIMRGEDDLPYCSQCRRLIQEEMPAAGTLGSKPEGA